MFRPGYNSSSLPPQTCANTTSELLTIPANLTQGWLALNLVNAGSVSKLSVSVDGHSMYVYAADGLYVALQEVKVCESQTVYIRQKLILLGSPILYRPTLFGDDQAQ